MIRVGLSGIYLTEKFPGEDKEQKTAIEDCSEARRRYYLSTLNDTQVRKTFDKLLSTMKMVIKHIQSKGLVDEQTAERMWNTRHLFIDTYKTPTVDKRREAIDMLCKRIKELEGAAIATLHRFNEH